MNWRNVVLIFRREVVDQFRDRRTLFMVAVLPILLYPIMGVGMVLMTNLLTQAPKTVVILGAADLPEPQLFEKDHFSRDWFNNPSDADRLRVVSDISEPSSSESADTKTQAATDDGLLAHARQLRELILERQQIEQRLSATRQQSDSTEKASLEKSLHNLDARLSSLFAKSDIQVLVHVPSDFAKNLRQQQELLSNRDPSSTSTFEYPRPLIVHDSADDKSMIAYQSVRAIFRFWERSILKSQLQQSHLPMALIEPIKPTEIDLAKQDQVSANVWSKMFPAILVMMALTGAFYPAIDLCAGEKERGTMETLLICPASRMEIVLGKFLTVLVFSATTALLNLASVGITGKYVAALAVGASRFGDLALPPVSSLVWLIIILLPLSTLFSALCLAIATFAKSSKEGQYYLTPLLMVTLGLTMFCLMPGTEMKPFQSVMPIIGPGLLLKGLLKANGPNTEIYLYAIPVLITSFVYSALAIWWAIEQFGSEDVLFREAERFDLRLWIKHLLRDKEPVPTFAEAVFCYLMILLLQFASWGSFQSAILETAEADLGWFQLRLLMIQQLALIATPALMMGVMLTTSMRRTFSVRWPGFGRLACAMALPFALHPLSVELLQSLSWFFPPVPAGMEKLTGYFKDCDTWLVILAMAVTPAICEEIAFRGFMLAGFRRMGRVRLAVVLSSLAFGIIHMIPQQVFNATLLGLILGAVCVRTRSLFPGIAFHFIYNSIGVLHSRMGHEVPTEHVWSLLFRREEGALRYQPLLLCVLAIVAVAILRQLLKPAAIPDLPDLIIPSTDRDRVTSADPIAALHN